MQKFRQITKRHDNKRQAPNKDENTNYIIITPPNASALPFPSPDKGVLAS